jgi:hypothetical protein
MQALDCGQANSINRVVPDEYVVDSLIHVVTQTGEGCEFVRVAMVETKPNRNRSIAERDPGTGVACERNDGTGKGYGIDTDATDSTIVSGRPGVQIRFEEVFDSPEHNDVVDSIDTVIGRREADLEELVGLTESDRRHQPSVEQCCS